MNNTGLEWAKVIIPFASGLVVALIGRAWLLRDTVRSESATVEAKHIDDNAAIRGEIWKRMEQLEAEVARLNTVLAVEQQKNIECERRAMAMEMTIRSQDERIQSLEAIQNGGGA